MNEIADFTALLTTLGILAFLVSVITQVTKELKFLRKIPTSLQVTVTSIAITEIANASYNKIPIEWYCIVGAVVGGFVVAFIAMFGWEKLSDLYGRFRKK